MRVDLTDSSLSVSSFLVRNRADIDSSLTWAAKNGSESIVRYLVTKGADIHTRHDWALRWATRKGYESIVRYLIENGADIHTCNDCAFRWAARNGHESIVRYLAERGANVHADDDCALRWASMKGHESIVRYLTDEEREREREDYELLRINMSPCVFFEYTPTRKEGWRYSKNHQESTLSSV